MKVKKVSAISSLKREYEVLGTSSGRRVYNVCFSNTPSCTCPDFQKHGMEVYGKHLLFIMMFVLKITYYHPGILEMMM